MMPTKPVTSKLGNPNTESENLFEEYLTAHGFGKWDHEVPVEGKKKTPDYLLEHGGLKYIFEVKEFDSQPPVMGLSTFDPYRPIREKVNKATRQFKDYKEFPCSLVLANPQDAFVRLGDWWAISGTMLGDVGFRIPVNTVTGTVAADRIEPAYLGGGKMIDHKRRQPQNTTVSAVIVLGTYPLRRNLIRIKVKEREAVLGRRLSLEEHMAIDEATIESSDMRKVRVVVYENPYARIPLNQEMFRGPFDERFGIEPGGDCIVRTFVGTESFGFNDIRQTGGENKFEDFLVCAAAEDGVSADAPISNKVEHEGTPRSVCLPAYPHDSVIPVESEEVRRESIDRQVYIFNAGPFPHMRELGSYGTIRIPPLEASACLQSDLRVAGPVIIPGRPNEYYPGVGRKYHTPPDRTPPGIHFALEVIGARRGRIMACDWRSEGVFISQDQVPNEKVIHRAQRRLRETAQARCEYLSQRWEAGGGMPITEKDRVFAHLLNDNAQWAKAYDAEVERHSQFA
jgi:hypothetical protein